MNKSIWALRVLLILAAATPALPREPDFPYPDRNDDTDFNRYRPFHFQIDGGPTITQGTAEQNLNNGWNAGIGLTWYPTSHLPLGLRIDGSYNRFDARGALLGAAAARAQTPINNGTIKIWGADVDLELGFRIGSRAKIYLIGGVGWYDEQDTFRQGQVVRGTICDWFGCVPGTDTKYSIVTRSTTGIHFAKNAGLGLQIALSEGAAFFVDARYVRINPSSRKSDFLPIRFGLRF